MFSPDRRKRFLIQLGATVVGSILYSIAIYLTSSIQIPSADNVQLRPGVAIPIICGALFGPIPGFVSGFVGNLVADWALDWGFWPYWYIGNGLMGLASGLFRPEYPDYRRFSTAFNVVVRAAAGIIAGMAVASISEHWVSQSSWSDV